MKQDALIKKINAAIEGARATPRKEFDGRENPGIWFRGSEQCFIDGQPLFDYYNDDQQVHPTLEAILKKAGWYWEPYDSGTLMAYPA